MTQIRLPILLLFLGVLIDGNAHSVFAQGGCVAGEYQDSAGNWHTEPCNSSGGGEYGNDEYSDPSNGKNANFIQSLFQFPMHVIAAGVAVPFCAVTLNGPCIQRATDGVVNTFPPSKLLPQQQQDDSNQQGSNTPFFGTGGSPNSNLTSTALGSGAPLSATGPVDQINNTPYQTTGQTFDGGYTPTDAVPAKPLTGPVHFPAINTQKPPAAVTALMSHIPSRAANDPRISKLLTDTVNWYYAVENVRAETQVQLDTIQQQLNDGTGNATVLTAQKDTLTNKMNQIDQDEQKAQNEIKKQLTDDGYKWIESPQAASGAPVTQ